MSKRKQQSVSRAFRRNNAILEFNHVTKAIETVFRKFTNHNGFGGWKNRVKTRALQSSMDDYCENVIKPIKKWNLQA